MAFEHTSIKAPKKRDLRIDFFRGLALYMIFIDHVIEDPLSHFTFHAIGFSDATEIFVFLSGLGCGIAYSRTLARQGWSGAIRAAIRRALRIYYFYLASGAAVIVLAAMTANIWTLTKYEQTLGFASNEPLSALWRLLVMISSPADSGILVLYLFLTLIVVPLFLAGRRYATVALAASGCVWLMARTFHDASAFLIGGWFLNPFAWQFLFSIGMYFGVRWDCQDAVDRPRIWPRLLLFAAWAIVTSAFLYKLFLFLAPYAAVDTDWLRIATPVLADMKRHLSPVRLLHFLSMVYLATAYLPAVSPLMRGSLARPLVLCGQHSLEIFSLTILLDMIANIAVITYQPLLAGKLLIDCVAISLIALGTIGLTRSKTPSLASVTKLKGS